MFGVLDGAGESNDEVGDCGDAVVAVTDAAHGGRVVCNGVGVGREVLGLISEALDEVGGAGGDG